MPPPTLPASIRDVDHLEDLLSEPSEAAIQTLADLPGDILFLGVAGKMGPTLARMARRASDQAGVKRRILGVSRFSDPQVRERLQSQDIETIACDLLDPAQLEKLPDVPNVVYMSALKFGSTGQEAQTWAMNCVLPARVCEKYRHSRIVLFSTGNVYRFSPIHLGGSVEAEPLQPVGEYAMSCLGKERVAEYLSRSLDIPLAVIRLNYANEMRYGVLVDIAQRVWSGQPVDVRMGALNAIWQADANAMSLAAFAHVASPPFVVNVAGPETLSVRRVAEQFACLMKKDISVQGEEATDALLSNAQKAFRLFGYPRVTSGQMIAWIAEWVQRGGTRLGKPTHFEVRDGKF
jgi:hypothetical protein